MSKPKVTVNVYQDRGWPVTDPRSRDAERAKETSYYVVSVTNATEPEIGDMISKKEVERLVYEGATVNIKPRA
jgi:hypothetical protein